MPGDEAERLGAAMAFASRHRSGKKSRDHSPAGRHLHPRAVRVHLPRDEDHDMYDEDDEEPTPREIHRLIVREWCVSLTTVDVQLTGCACAVGRGKNTRDVSFPFSGL